MDLRSKDGEGEDANRSAALSQKAVLQMLLPATTPPVKMEQRNARRRSVAPKLKIILPLMMAKAHAAAISNQKRLTFQQGAQNK